MEERRGELALHPLAERELAGRLPEERPDPEELDELVERLLVLLARDVVDRAIQLEGLGGREVPQELLLLPRHEHDRAKKIGLPESRRETGDARFSRGRVEEAGEHLERVVVFPAPFGPRNPTPLAGGEISEREVVHRHPTFSIRRCTSDRIAARTHGGRLWTA